MAFLPFGALVLSADVATDGSFEVRNVSSRTYQAIVLRTCKGCSASGPLSTMRYTGCRGGVEVRMIRIDAGGSSRMTLGSQPS